MTTQFCLQSTAPPDCSAFRSRLATFFFLRSNALAGPLELGVPPKLSLLRTVGDDEFYTRAVLAGVFVGDDDEPDRSLDKGRKIYSLGGPTPTLTSSNNFHFIGNRSADPNLAGVRQLEFVGILNISGDPLFSERAWWPSCVSMGPNAGPAGASIFLV